VIYSIYLQIPKPVNQGNMKCYLVVLLCVLSATMVYSQPVSIALTHVNVIAMTTPGIQSDMTVLLSGNKITGMGKNGKIKIPAHALIIDASGKYLIPGLWDMHVHVFHYRHPDPPDTFDFPLFIANGVTGVREMWTKGENMNHIRLWRRQFYDQPGTIPRFVSVGTLVDGLPNTHPNCDTVSTAAEARRMVDKIKASGVDFVKVYDNLNRESYFAIVDEAKKQHIPFAGHIPFSILLKEASDAGQRSVEHLTGGSTEDCKILEIFAKHDIPEAKASGSPDLPYMEQVMEVCNEEKAMVLFRNFAKNDTWEVPTLIIKKHYATDTANLRRDERLKYIPGGLSADYGSYWWYTQAPGLRDTLVKQEQRCLELVRWMHKAGIKFMAGTDVSNPYSLPGFSLHDELGMFVEAGFTPYEALKTATINPAIFMSMTDSLGSIEKGKNADLVLLNANPLVNINNTKQINAVIVNGKFLSRDVLDKMLSDAAELAKKN
jgi:imidazolonepropionase-like amidohydrolase